MAGCHPGLEMEAKTSRDEQELVLRLKDNKHKY